MRREELQLPRFALFIENLNSCQPACLRRTVQLAWECVGVKNNLSRDVSEEALIGYR
jgi:uncharacterized protein YjaG (DUF416 family)